MSNTVLCSGLAIGLFGLATAYWLGWLRTTEPETTHSTFTLQDAKDAVLQEILSGKIEIPVKREASTFTLQEARDAVLKELLSGNIELPPKGESQSEAPTYLPLQEKKDIEEMLKEFCLSELRQQAASQTRLYEEQLQTLKREFEDKLVAVREHISSVNSTVFGALDDARSEMAGRQRDLDDLLRSQPLTLETRGFMNIETFGPILISVAVVEVVLVMCVCGLLCPASGRRSGTGQLQGGTGKLQGGTGPGQSHSDSPKERTAEQPGRKLLQQPPEAHQRIVTAATRDDKHSDGQIQLESSAAATQR